MKAKRKPTRAVVVVKNLLAIRSAEKAAARAADAARIKAGVNPAQIQIVNSAFKGRLRTIKNFAEAMEQVTT